MSRLCILARALALLVLGVFAIVVDAHAACPEPIATAVSVQGTVEVRRSGSAEWSPVALGDALCPADTVRVGQHSRADISMLDQSVLRMRAGTELTLEGVSSDERAVIDLLQGAAHFFSRSGARSLDVKTPHAVAGVRGTEFFVELAPEQTLVSVFDGRVLAQNSAGSVEVVGGQSAVAAAGRAPTLRVVARPRDAVQWTLHYLPVLQPDPQKLSGAARASAEAYLAGNLRAALDALAQVRIADDDAALLGYRAALLLAVGSIDEAQADLDRALRARPDDANALALRATIAIAQNDIPAARAAAQRAVAQQGASAAGHIALSYAQQASFDLEGARASVETAVGLEPENALAWARLAELHSSFGDLDAALEAAERAESLAPGLSRTQTVLGFAHLARIDTERARTAFQRAIELDQADPLPRLGLGLARIRDGELSQGSREIEIAASLDPSDALVRSYLGKAYFEEKRSGLDQREFEQAKQLDPMDPTPWLYSAIAKQTTNRPVEALRELNRAIELNDNRAVYRSRLLLDSDVAARSAGQGRIYSDLGFQQLALVEAWRSTNVDPSNFSAHRLLADSYAALPRHEIARVSELLQSQLLQPNNVTPIQPRLAESNLFLISGGGPASLSFNEFNPLFDRDRVAVQTAGSLGENGTRAGEGIVSGIWKQLSFSAGYSDFASDGFRQNNDQDDQLVNAFAQLELSPKTAIQTEYRRRDLDTGDLELRFFPDDFRPTLDTETTASLYRLGARHAFSPGNVVLASYMHQDRDDSLFERPSVPFVLSIDQERDDQRSDSIELQHLFRLDWLSVTTGMGHFDINREEKLVTEVMFVVPFPPFVINDTLRETLDLDVTHTNVYAYSNLSLPHNVTLTLGASGDFFDADSSSSEKKDQFNPKFGLIWNPLPATTVRLAAFRALKRSLITDQTLEPTQVAGFNQFFDDADATSAWRYGIALDQKLASEVFAGAELSKRELDVPFSDVVTLSTREAEWDEYLARTYLFYLPHEWVALSVEYAYENVQHDGEFPFAFEEVTTHRVPLGARFFHPSGLTAGITTTFYDQDGDFERRGSGVFDSDSDEFWVVDAMLGYRLPGRYGFVTFGATNLLDREFSYQAADFDNPLIQPDRMLFGRVTLAFP